FPVLITSTGRCAQMWWEIPIRVPEDTRWTSSTPSTSMHLRIPRLELLGIWGETACRRTGAEIWICRSSAPFHFQEIEGWSSEQKLSMRQIPLYFRLRTITCLMAPDSSELFLQRQIQPARCSLQ